VVYLWTGSNAVRRATETCSPSCRTSWPSPALPQHRFGIILKFITSRALVGVA
jgi:hypothetical protein